MCGASVNTTSTSPSVCGHSTGCQHSSIIAVSQQNTRQTKTCDPLAGRTKTCGLRKTQPTYGRSIMALGSFHEPPASPKLAALCLGNVSPLAAGPHCATVAHQLHHNLAAVPSVCQMCHSVWTCWPNRCELYRSNCVSKTAGDLCLPSLFISILAPRPVDNIAKRFCSRNPLTLLENSCLRETAVTSSDGNPNVKMKGTFFLDQAYC